MSIREIVNILTSAGIEENEANAEVKLLIEKFCNLTAVDIVMGKKLDESKLALTIFILFIISTLSFLK